LVGKDKAETPSEQTSGDKGRRFSGKKQASHASLPGAKKLHFAKKSLLLAQNKADKFILSPPIYG
jgi:hypothetical protein